MSSSLSKRLGERTPADRVALAISAIVLAYALYSCARFALQDDVRHLLVRIVDDASYYMTAARNLAAGRGLTFDGIHPTNGFHPLWLLLLVPLFLLHATPETMIRLVALLQTVLLSLAYLIWTLPIRTGDLVIAWQLDPLNRLERPVSKSDPAVRRNSMTTSK